MAFEIAWTHEATFDLDTIADYISRDSIYYASIMVQEFMEAARSLNQFAERGRVVPELKNETIRELMIREYRLIYSIELKRISILGVIHGRRDLKKLWKKRN